LCDEDFGIDTEQLVAHARRHFREDYLTLPQVKALRKITGKSALISTSANSSSSTVASNDPTPGPSRVLDVEPAFQQTSRSIHGNAGTEISIKPTDAEKYSLLVLFDGKRQQINWNLETYLER
jgi:hypothetical protein